MSRHSPVLLALSAPALLGAACSEAGDSGTAARTTTSGWPVPRRPSRSTLGRAPCWPRSRRARNLSGDVTSDDRYVWVRNADDFLVRIEPSTGEVVRYTSQLTTGGSLAVAGGDLWLAADDMSTLLRLHSDT